MDLISYMRIFRRRWILLLVPLLGAVAIAWVTLPDGRPTGPIAPSYTATATLIFAPTYDEGDNQTQLSLPTAALFATVGDVPKAAAKRLGYSGQPQVLASQVTVTPRDETNTITITATDPSSQVAAARANAFAGATTQFFQARAQEDVKNKIAVVKRQLRSVGRQIRGSQLSPQGGVTDPVVKAQQQSLQSQYSAQFSRLGELNRQLGIRGPLDVLQSGVAIPEVTSGFTAPSSPAARLGTSALLGLLLGIALALLIERIDSRLRTREQVEDSFGLPVLAEIPSLPLGQRGKRTIVSARMPASATAEAHRALRSAVLLLGPDGGVAEGAHSLHASSPLIVLVTSALPGEGKTTTVANLAAVMAEAGRRVLVLSFDLRNPRIHEYFELDNGVGVSDLLGRDRQLTLDMAVRQTQLNGVELVTSGQRLDHPGALLTSAGPLLEAARERADVVLIDTAPMLTASDAIDLAQYIDVALVVSRLNKTTTTHAAATQRLLSRLGVPALGTVLVGSRSTGSHDRAYRLAGRPSMTRGPVEEGVHEARETDSTSDATRRGQQ